MGNSPKKTAAGSFRIRSIICANVFGSNELCSNATPLFLTFFPESLPALPSPLPLSPINAQVA